jgi:outer membrane murein-binding lipoprotein Lpp
MRAALTIASVALVSLLLSGCVPPQPVETPSPEASVTPIFATDEEALAAATAAYAAYLTVSDQIAADGGANPERLEPFVTPDQFATASSSFAVYVEKGLRSEGASSFDSVSLTQYDESSDVVTIDVYLCLDVSQVRAVDSAGTVVTPVDRINRLPLQIGFEAKNSLPIALTLARSEPWSGVNFC